MPNETIAELADKPAQELAVQHTASTQESKRPFNIFASQAFVALLLVVAANFLLVAFNPFTNVDPDSLPALKSWIFWTKQDYEHMEPKADVVMLGSSLLMNSVWMQEAEHLQKDVDIVVNRRSKYFESQVQKYIPAYKGAAFNFGLPGSMLSDDYMIERTMFDGDRKPRFAVLCLGPRDLMDTSFSCAGATTHFKYLEKFTDTRDLLDIAYTSAWPKINFVLREAIYCLGKKHHAQIASGEALKPVSEAIFKPVTGPSPFNIKTDFDKQFAFYKTEVEKGVFIAKPNAQTDSFFDNGKDWKKRFKDSNDEMFANQMIWFEKLMKELKAKNIAAVLVNMPVSELGAKYIPPAVYKRHIDALQTMARQYDCLYVDTMQQGDVAFDMKDFSDYGHMDASGGRKVVDIVARAMAQDPRCKSLLSGGSR